MEWIAAIIAALSLVQVVDGDTLKMPNGQNVRLQRYNTPELKGKCPFERQRAATARDRLQELMRAKGAVIVLNVNTTQCAYDRPCATLIVNGRDVADTLVEEGLAEPMLCPGGRCPKPKDWCSG